MTSAGLDAQTRSLVHVAVAVATGDTEALKQRLLAARAAPVPDRWVDELLLQSLLNVGYALGLQAFGVWRELTQLHAHPRGALNTGWTPAEVDDVLALVEQDVGAERALQVWELWAEVRARKL